MNQYKVLVAMMDGTDLDLGPYDLFPGETVADVAEDIYHGDFFNDRLLWIDGGDSEQTILPSGKVLIIRVLLLEEQANQVAQDNVVDIMSRHRHPAGTDTA